MKADKFISEFYRIKKIGAFDFNQTPLEFAIHEELQEREAIMYIRFLLALGFTSAEITESTYYAPVLKFTK